MVSWEIPRSLKKPCDLFICIYFFPLSSVLWLMFDIVAGSGSDCEMIGDKRPGLIVRDTWQPRDSHVTVTWQECDRSVTWHSAWQITRHSVLWQIWHQMAKEDQYGISSIGDCFTNIKHIHQGREHQITWSLSADQKPVSRSRDHSQPIRSQECGPLANQRAGVMCEERERWGRSLWVNVSHNKTNRCLSTINTQPSRSSESKKNKFYQQHNA